MLSCPNPSNTKIKYNCKAKILGNPPTKVIKTKMQRNSNNVWNNAVPNWYYYSAMALQNSAAQPMSSQYQQQQQHQAIMPTMPQTYAYMPQQQLVQPYYYTQPQPESNINTLTMTMGQGQNQNQAQAQGQVQQMQQMQQMWHEYQAQQPQQNYSYWYGMQQQPAANSYGIDQSHTADIAAIIPQSFCQTFQPQPPGTQDDSCQTIKSRANARSSGGSPQDGFSSSQTSGSGTLSRIDSLTSFKNNRGLRIRNSQQEFEEYRRIAARNLSKRERKEAGVAKDVFKQAKLQPQQSKDRIRHSKSVNQNLVIEEPLATRGDSFFQRLGLFGGKDRGSIFSLKRKSSKNNSQPSFSSQISQDSQDCQNSHSCPQPTCRPKSYKKPNFLRRLFRKVENPTDVQLNATRFLAEQHVREAENLRNMRKQQTLNQLNSHNNKNISKQ